MLWILCHFLAHSAANILSFLGYKCNKVCPHVKWFYFTTFGFDTPVTYLFLLLPFPSYDLIKFLDLSKAYHTFLYYAFNTMLLMLLVFHIYWWVLICAMVWRQLKNRGKVGEDIRSGKLFTAFILSFKKLFR